MKLQCSIFGLNFSYFTHFREDELLVLIFILDSFEFLVESLPRYPKDFG